ncbi:MAG TPA: ATP-binding protein, partial [Gemmatimonadales bacterium]|nr:ATP-binding protein [Gemmatimonadales bacterium]
PLPLHERLATAAMKTFANTGIIATVEYSGEPCSFPPTVEEEIMAIAGEAMTNAREHAGSRSVHVSCGYEAGNLRVRVRDDGRGFDPSTMPTGHWGLIGMRERAAAIGARLTVSSAPGAGTDVLVVFRAESSVRRVWRRLIHRGSPDRRS